MKLSISVQLANLIIKDSFGDGMADVVGFLMKRHNSSWRIICAETKLPSRQVKLCLAIGIQHNFIMYSQNKRGMNEYSVNIQTILHRLRYPSYLYCMKMLYGNIAEVLVEEILHHGQVLHDSLINKTLARLTASIKTKVNTHDVENKLLHLVSSRFVEVCEEVRENEEDENTDQPPPSKRLKSEPETNKKCYRVCTVRFNMYHRDLHIMDAVTRKLGHKHGEVIGAMLRLSEVKSELMALESTPITSNELYAALPKDCTITSRGLLDVYLITLVDDEMGVLCKVGDSGGGSYTINYKQIMSSLCTKSMEALVLERFGSKSLRLFRLLLMKKHLEQKQLEELAMFPAKLVKELLYAMFSQKFVSITEVAKTADHAPSRTFYLFNVPGEQLAKQLQDHNYKSILNLMCKKTQILADNRRLLEKQQRVEAIIASLPPGEEEQKQEIEEMITPSERVQLNTVKLQTNKIENAEQQLAESSLVWETYLDNLCIKRISEAPKPRAAAR